MNASGHGQETAGHDHYAGQQAAPDLDAGAPSLRAEDVQRLNRKALVFLAGIVILLVLAIIGMLRAVGSGDGAVAAPREQEVVIPELPRVPAVPPVPLPPPQQQPVPVVPLATPPVLPANVPALPLPDARGPSLLERRSAAGDAGAVQDPYMQAMLAGLQGPEAPPPPPAGPAPGARPIMRADSLLVRGTYIRCVLETRIVTDVPGFTSCVVTEPVYSINGRRLLLPSGSKVLGRYDSEPRGPRVAVVWDRITTPTGIDIRMDSPGVDGLGGAGHPGHYSAHWGSRIGSALLVSLISDAFKYAAAKEGPAGAVIGEGGVVVHSPYESATARSLERLANQALDARRPPTVTIQNGTVLNVYVARDVDFRSGGAAVTTDGFLDYQYRALGILEHMGSPDVTEICINRPGEVWLETSAGWRREEVPGLSFERARQFCNAVVNESNTGQRITDAEPVVSLTFPTGQRAQFVIPPACEAGTVSITVRLPSRRARRLGEYEAEGFFSGCGAGAADGGVRELLALHAAGDHAGFFRRAVGLRRNIVVSGATGSGKTTFMKALVEHIPADERLVTIEDARELFISQPNAVHLLYSKGGQGTAKVTAKSCMEACLRMKPDRIILAELRGDEAFYFIRNCASGHPGSITSCHAGSTAQTWDQLALMVKASAEGAGLEYATIRRLLAMAIDVVVHIGIGGGRRHVTGVEFGAALGGEAAP